MEEKVNILVVDDLADKRLAFREVLDDLDENLVLVGSGAEALRELLEREFAVIVLDVNMPDIDGIETAELIRKHGRTSHTPIIFVTAYADEMQTERGYELGAVDYILTPIVPAILRSKVRVFVDLYRAQRRAAKVARAEAGRAAAEAARRSSELIALASRELSASLNLELSMERLLEVLVPTVGGCALLSVETDGRAVTMYRQDREPTRRRDGLTLVAAGGAARDERSITAAAMRSRCGSTRRPSADHWPEAAALRARRAAQDRASATSACFAVGVSSPESGPLDERGLLEVATRAAIAFDNAQLYSSLEREMARAKDAEEKLQQASRRKDEFLAMLSHELRNPLGADRDRGTSARQDRAERRAHRLGSRGHRAPSHAPRGARRRLARRVAHHAGQDHAEPRSRRARQGARAQHRDRAAALRFETPSRCRCTRPETPIWVFGDFSRLSQIFSNVLHNAAKYTADGGSIELGVDVDRGSVAVRVRDNGIGIDAAVPAARVRGVHAGVPRARSQPGRAGRRSRRRSATRGAASG